MVKSRCRLLQPLPNFYHDPPAHLPLDDTLAGRDDVFKRDLGRHRGNLRPVEISFKPTPRLLPQRQRTHDGVDADERDPP